MYTSYQFALFATKKKLFLVIAANDKQFNWYILFVQLSSSNWRPFDNFFYCFVFSCLLYKKNLKNVK